MVLKSSNKKGKKFYNIIYIILLITVLVFLYWFIYGNVWKIQKVEILNAKHTDINILKSDIDDFLDKKKLLIIPNDHIIFFSKKEMQNHILNTYPSVENVEIIKNRNREIIVTIKDRKATGVWCDENCFFFDDEGILFKKSFEFTGSVFATWSTVSSSTLKFYDKAICVDTCIDKNFVNFLSKNKIKKVLINGEELRMNTEQGYYIKALNNSNITIKNMNMFLNKYEDSLNTLDYVDVRFTDKIFYKMK